MGQVFALVDCNNFYASCERIFNPKMARLPVVVLSNNDGCIIARSNEAKAAGIRMGEPFFEQQSIIDRYNVQVFSANFALYGDMSNRVMDTLKKFSPQIEIYSIDEAFLLLNISETITLDVGKQIRAMVKKWTGIPVSVGMGPTKTLAKAASRFAKRSPECEGVFDLSACPDRERYLKELAVGDVWGIGLRYAKFLNRHGIYSAFQLINRSDAWIKKNMRVTGLRTVTELRGRPCIPFEGFFRPKKAVLTSRSFGHFLTDKAQLGQALAEFTSSSAEKIRKQRSAASFLHIFIETDRFRDEPQYNNFITIGLPAASSYTPDLIKCVMAGFEKIFRAGYRYKRAGVMLSGLVPDDQVQLDMDDGHCDYQKKRAVMQALDGINHSMGRNVLFYAAQGTNRTWKMRQLKLSPRYTTNWNDLPVVRA